MAGGLTDNDADEFLPDPQDEEGDAETNAEDSSEGDNNGPLGSSSDEGSGGDAEGEQENDVTQSVRLQIEQMLANGDFAAILMMGKAVPVDLLAQATTGLAEQLNNET
ncbi:MAG: hypothetical protein EBV03_13125, partial [Proteobacteria bacterium]|nr:hypothetical protein [Pseudomonadota bacterium]